MEDFPRKQTMLLLMALVVGTSIQKLQHQKERDCKKPKTQICMQ